ncbi:MAG: nitrophenyl compound nitroreductase subunit ArsF family protein [Candidatus Omnitrophota bacterium]
MKKLAFVILAVIAVVSASSWVVAEESASSAKVVVYYFHGSFRCVTCTNMEKYSREAVAAHFKDALAIGKLEFKAVNLEEKGHEHFVKDYQLYTKALVLSLVKDGQEIKSKNLDKIWQFSRNKQEFIQYVTGEIRGFMKDAP